MNDLTSAALSKVVDRKSTTGSTEMSPPFNEEIFRKLPVAIYGCDASGILTFYNEAAAALWGRRPEIGKERWCGAWKMYSSGGVLLNPEDGPMAISFHDKKAATGHQIIIERPDGRRLNVQSNPQLLFDQQGRLTGAVNVLIDITGVRTTDARIIEEEERFRILADQAPIMIWQSDKHGKCVFVNEHWKKVTGSDEPKFFQDEWTRLVHPDDRERVFNEWQQAVSAQAFYRSKHRLLTSTQEFILVQASATPMFNTAKNFVGFIGVIHDITFWESVTSSLEKEAQERTAELIRKNSELKRSEQLYHKMIAEVQDYAILLLDTEGNIQNWNKGAEHIKGYSAHEAIGMNFKKFYTPEDLLAGLPDSLLETARTQGRATSEGWRVRKDKTMFWGSVVITSLHDENNNIVGFSKVTRDLTERKKAEDTLKESSDEIRQKNRELELMNQELASFAYVSSHDLQEPLRKIQTFSSRIMETEKHLSEKGKDYFSRMQNAAFRMQTLIEDLLAYSRTNTSEKKFETADLNKVVADVRSELRERIEEKHAVIEVDNLPTMEIIVFQFRQLLNNILGNALKFSKADVAPEIAIRYESAKASRLGITELDQKKVYHHFSIADNGIGFEPEHKNKIFEVFQRLHGRSEYSGTGIGLAICKKIVENHGGIIQADAEPGQGATFHIYIPVSKK